jgi:isoquinoline 1-oxidoreductase beta subunit
VDGPVQVVWTREDDIRHDRYRPSSLHLLRGAIDDDGLPSAWHWRILNTYTDRFDPGDFPAFCVPNYLVEYTHVPFVLPRGAWRATVNSYNPFVVQAFVDELAIAAGRDPVDVRLDMLRRSKRKGTNDAPYDNERMIRVVEMAAEKAGWGSSMPAGEGRGVAFYFGYESYVAEVAEVAMENGRPRVRRVVCVVDCGEVINPDLVEAQCEGAIAFALSAALKQKITVAQGRVQESNFSDYPMLEIGEMPAIESHILESRAAPGGMGEVPLPPLAAAVANAIFDASGQRVRRLPIMQ